MKLKIGTFEFQANRTWLTWRYTPVFSNVGRRMQTNIVASFGGSVSGANLAALETIIENTQNAAQTMNLDFGLFQNDGTTPTKHVLLTANTINGTRFELEWVKGQVLAAGGNGAQYVNRRSFVGRMFAEVAANEKEIIDWHEDMRQIGTGGIEKALKESLTGAPEKQEVQQQTGVILIQEGYAVGWSAYPSFPAPNSAPDLRVKLVVQEKGTPKFGRNLSTRYPIRWRYYHELVTAPGSVPTPTALP